MPLYKTFGAQNMHTAGKSINCPERALQVKAELEKRGNYREIVITGTAGVATVYAGDGGIVLAVG